MRFNCVHTFILEAEDQEDFDAKLARYKRLVNAASRKLGIGYDAGLVLGRPSTPWATVSERDGEPDKPIERLFD